MKYENKKESLIVAFNEVKGLVLLKFVYQHTSKTSIESLYADEDVYGVSERSRGLCFLKDLLKK